MLFCTPLGFHNTCSSSSTELALQCVNLCDKVSACIGFDLYTREDSSYGHCCLRGYYNPVYGGRQHPQIDYWSRPECRVCRADHYSNGGIGCERFDHEPYLETNYDYSKQWYINPDTPIGTEAAVILPKSDDGRAVTGYIDRVDWAYNDFFAYNHTSGSLVIKRNDYQTYYDAERNGGLVDYVRILLRAYDDRTICNREHPSIPGRLARYGGPCRTYKYIYLDLVRFNGCPDALFTLMENGRTTARIPFYGTLLRPRFQNGVNQTDGTIDGARIAFPLNLPPSTYNIYYESTPVDVGGRIICSFEVTVVSGATQLTNGVGHEVIYDPATGYPLRSFDFVVDSSGITDEAITALPSLSADINFGVAIGLRPPTSDPFSFFMQGKDIEAQWKISLQWCTSGLLTESEVLEPGILTVAFRGRNGIPIIFNDTESGYTADGRCFRFRSESVAIKTGRLSFWAIDLFFKPLGAVIPDDRRRSVRQYYPVRASDQAFVQRLFMVKARQGM